MSYTDNFRDDGGIDVPLDEPSERRTDERDRQALADDRQRDRRDDRQEDRRDDRRSDPRQSDLISGDEGIKRLRSDLDRVTRTATEAVQRATRAEQALEEGRQRLETVERTAVDNEMKSAEDRVADAKAKFKVAYDSADADAIADAQDALGEAQADLRDIKRRREQAQTTQTEQRGHEGRVDLPSDPVERYIAANKMSQRAADWIRNHPECVTDEEKYYQMHAADARARRNGHRPGSDKYFEEVEKEMGYDSRARDNRDDRDYERRDDPPRERREERRPAGGAPPSRDPGGPDGRPTRPSSIRLSGDEREMAHLSFPELKPEEAERVYARNKADLIAEGRIGNDRR